MFCKSRINLCTFFYKYSEVCFIYNRYIIYAGGINYLGTKPTNFLFLTHLWCICPPPPFFFVFWFFVRFIFLTHPWCICLFVWFFLVWGGLFCFVFWGFFPVFFWGGGGGGVGCIYFEYFSIWKRPILLV